MRKRISILVIVAILLLACSKAADTADSTMGSSTDDSMFYTKHNMYPIGENFPVFKTEDKSAAFRYYITDAGIYKDTGIHGTEDDLHTFVYIEVTIENVSNKTLTPEDITIYTDDIEITNDRTPYACNNLVMKSIKPKESIKGTVYRVCDNYYEYEIITAHIYNAQIIIY